MRDIWRSVNGEIPLKLDKWSSSIYLLKITTLRLLFHIWQSLWCPYELIWMQIMLLFCLGLITWSQPKKKIRVIMKGSTERCVTSWIINTAMKDKVSIWDKVMLEWSVVHFVLVYVFWYHVSLCILLNHALSQYASLFCFWFVFAFGLCIDLYYFSILNLRQWWNFGCCIEWLWILFSLVM